MHLVIGFVNGSKTKPNRYNRTLNARCFQRFEEVTCNCQAFCLVHHAVCSRCDWSKYICRSSLYHLRNLSKIRKYLTKESAAVVVHAFFTSKLGYCNVLLYGLPKYQLERLQYVQNTAASVVLQIHWLPIQYRIVFKIMLSVYKSLNGTYIAQLFSSETTLSFSLGH